MVFPKKLIILSSVACLLIIIGVFWSARHFQNKEAATPAAINSASPESSVKVYVPPTSQVSAESREYKNLLFRFSLVYPQDLRVKEYDDGTSASTITLEDDQNEKGFQIFVVPYQEQQIAKSQILKDIPSGQFTEPVEIIIGNDIHALAFTSTGPLGEMREIWFLRNGFLYEITTYVNLDSWLARILATWHFD